MVKHSCLILLSQHSVIIVKKVATIVLQSKVIAVLTTKINQSAISKFLALETITDRNHPFLYRIYYCFETN